jgi:hypothetical protein
MARDEMKMITEDRWDEDIWGVESSNPDAKEAIPKLFFYFGQKVSFKTDCSLMSNPVTDCLKDHWVADHTRDALIAAREGIEGQSTGKPKMLIDQDGIPHGFCISKFPGCDHVSTDHNPEHGELVAEKVKLWIDEILNSG